MGRKARRRRKSRQDRKPTTPQPSASLAEEASKLRTPIGDFVRPEGQPPFVEYYLFRSDHDQLLMECIERRRAGEEVDLEETYRRLRRYGLLMVAIDEQGFEARLFLDRTLVEKSELETLIEETHHLLGQIPSGPEGGVLSVHWMEDIGDYSVL